MIAKKYLYLKYDLLAELNALLPPGKQKQTSFADAVTASVLIWLIRKNRSECA
jgi:hypothetical protein